MPGHSGARVQRANPESRDGTRRRGPVRGAWQIDRDSGFTRCSACPGMTIAMLPLRGVALTTPRKKTGTALNLEMCIGD